MEWSIKLIFDKWSKFERRLRVKLGVVVSLFLMIQLISVHYRLVLAFSKSSSKNVIGDDSFLETGIAWERVSQLNILFSLFFSDMSSCPFVSCVSHRFSKLLILADGKLVGFSRRIVKATRLNYLTFLPLSLRFFCWGLRQYQQLFFEASLMVEC